jgi:hypothetical protein
MSPKGRNSNLNRRFENLHKSTTMKKSVITKIAILFSAGLFGSMTAIYSIYDMDVPMGITIPMLIVSILLVAVSMQWLEKELKKIIK